MLRRNNTTRFLDLSLVQLERTNLAQNSCDAKQGQRNSFVPLSLAIFSRRTVAMVPSIFLYLPKYNSLVVHRCLYCYTSMQSVHGLRNTCSQRKINHFKAASKRNSPNDFCSQNLRLTWQSIAPRVCHLYFKWRAKSSTLRLLNHVSCRQGKQDCLFIQAPMISSFFVQFSILG